MNNELSIFRPGWTQDNLNAYHNLHFCGVKKGYFDRTHGMPGHQLDVVLARRKNQDKNRGGE